MPNSTGGIVCEPIETVYRTKLVETLPFCGEYLELFRDRDQPSRCGVWWRGSFLTAEGMYSANPFGITHFGVMTSPYTPYGEDEREIMRMLADLSRA
jgi:hypothetical protein